MKNNDIASNTQLENIAQDIANSMLSQEATSIIKVFPNESPRDYNLSSVMSFGVFKAITKFSAQYPQAAYNILKTSLLPDTNTTRIYIDNLTKCLAKKLSEHEKFPEFLQEHQEHLHKLETLCRVLDIVTDDDSPLIKRAIKPKYASVLFKDPNLMKTALKSYGQGNYLGIINAGIHKFASDNSFRKTCIELMSDVAKDTFEKPKSIANPSSEHTDRYNRGATMLFNDHNKQSKHSEPLVSYLLNTNHEELSRKIKK